MKFIREEARRVKIEKLLKDAPPELIGIILLEVFKRYPIKEKMTKTTFRLEDIKY
ncbi:hypothetical protein NUBL13938_51420 [Klebsiella pneumoniae]|nr:hypothetical protein NUBL13938_51420 [Klebsiella pneumoniae]HCI7934432.1 hypothetical protein [Klebsiella pneumoniae]